MCARRLLDRVKLFPHSSHRCDPISTTQKQRQRFVKSNFRLAASAKRNTWSMRLNLPDSVDCPGAVAEVVRAGAEYLDQLLGELNRNSENLHWFLFSGGRRVVSGSSTRLGTHSSDTRSRRQDGGRGSARPLRRLNSKASRMLRLPRSVIHGR